MSKHLTGARGALLLNLALAASACGGGGVIDPAAAGAAGGQAEGGAAGSGNSAPPAVTCDEDGASLAELDADELYELGHVPTFDFILEPARWQELKRNARDEQYVEAEACFDGKRLGVVGLRFKGGFGTLYSCFDAQGNQTCPKLSMKVKLDEYVPGQRLYRQNKVNLHSMIGDPSHLRERIAYGLYRAMGVAAPRSSWARARVNGENQGLFSLVEEVDKRFLVNHFPGADGGDLYKEAWPLTSDPAYYAERAETNESEATHAGFLGLFDALTAAQTEQERLQALDSWSHPDELARYMAVDDTILNWDGVTAFYPSGDGSSSGNHNHYTYFPPGDGRLVLIPWDLDNTLRASTPMNLVPHWTTQPDDCAARHTVFGGSVSVVAPGCDPLLGAVASDPAAYRLALEELLATAFSADTLDELVSESSAFIEPAVAEDPYGPGLPAFRSEVQALERQLSFLRTRAELLVSGQLPEPFALTATTVNDFEAATDLGVALGATVWTSSGTGQQLTVGTEDALAGAQNLRLSFDFLNSPTPWGQYVSVNVPLREGVVDLSARSGVRFQARASDARPLRLDIESPAHTAASSGLRFGWDVMLSTESRAYELSFASLAVPSWAVQQGLDPGDDLEAALRTVTGLSLNPQCLGRLEDGLLPEGTTDSGFIEIDSIEFF